MSVRHALWLAAALSAACGRTRPPEHTAFPAPAREPADVLLGRWEYVAPATRPRHHPALGAGFRVAVQFDSAAGNQAFGRVVTWFAGDVGLAPTMFGRVEGEVSQDGNTRMSIPFARAEGPAMTISGRLAGDTLAITDARQGDEPGPFSTAAGAAFVRRTP